jgi:hypothetical protein
MMMRMGPVQSWAPIDFVALVGISALLGGACMMGVRKEMRSM